jgi:integrase
MNFTVNGQRVCRTTSKQTKREAKAVEAAERQKILKQSKLTPEEKGAKTLLLNAVAQVYESRYRHGKDGQRSYRRAVNLAAIVGNIPLSDITDTSILHLTKTLEVNGSKSSTINRYLACLKTVLRDHNQPVDGIKLRKEADGRIRVLSKEEEAKVINLLRFEQGERRKYFAEVGDLVVILSNVGCRLGEALALKYEDINYDSNLITIWINKSSRPRSIPMTRKVRSILKSRQRLNPVKPFTVKPYQVSTAWNWVRREMGLEGDDQFVPHSLRHTCASRLVSAGVDLYVVKEILGHSTIQITERYAHLAPHKLASAILALED